jgi:hypothetical protein
MVREGGPSTSSHHQPRKQVFPFGIFFIDEPHFPGTISGFQALLSLNSKRHRVMSLDINQALAARKLVDGPPSRTMTK